ncbi:MAG: helix-turn-helix domain-containing protein [Alphaproteobacteria bacterium]|nr:helix-turn-helix domain-containing protein [Alphaproteobacteria bacterium]
MPINLERLREARQMKGLTLQKVAARMGISPPQVQRLETGERRMTIDMLEDYCAAVGLSPLTLFSGDVHVPIIGVIDVHSNILPVPAGSPSSTRAPHIVPDPQRLAAVRWEARTRFELMTGHLAFFLADVKGVPDYAWGRRCLLRRADGTQRIGWPFREDGQIHINETTGQVEFNVRLEWASPILAMVAPQVLE